MQDIDRMTGGELQMAREYLGLTIVALADILGVREDTVKKWESGKDPIPYRLWNEIQHLEDVTAETVTAMITILDDMPDPAAKIFRTDEAFRTANPHHAQFTARWWRHCVARACQEVPGVIIFDAATTAGQRIDA